MIFGGLDSVFSITTSPMDPIQEWEGEIDLSCPLDWSPSSPAFFEDSSESPRTEMSAAKGEEDQESPTSVFDLPFRAVPLLTSPSPDALPIDANSRAEGVNISIKSDDEAAELIFVLEL
jgi:hypothetical protein